MKSNLNSPASTSHAVYGIKSGKAEDLRKVANYQKVIWICAIVYLAVTICYWAIPGKSADLILGILMPVLGIPGGIFTIIFAAKLRNIVLMIFLIIVGLCAFCPVVGFFPLMIASAIGAYILKKNGIRVGILGARM